jgi:hypothetical protein
MASDLGLTISVSGAVAAAMAAFGDLKSTLQSVSEITKKLKADKGKLGNAIKDAAKLPQSDLGELNACYAKKQELLTRLRAGTQALAAYGPTSTPGHIEKPQKFNRVRL